MFSRTKPIFVIFSSKKSPYKWTILLGIIIASHLTILFNYSLWRQWGVPHMEPTFLDSHAILSASDCNLMGYDVYQENPCDVLRRPHVYSKLWLFIGYAGLGREHLQMIGMILLILFYLLSLAIIRPGNFFEFLLSLLFLISPPFLLCVERANNDIIIFILLSIAGILMLSGKMFVRWFSYGMIYLVAFLKFYPAASLSVLLFSIRNKKEFWGVALASAAIIGGFIWVTYDDFITISRVIPNPRTLRFTFGSRYLLDCLGFSRHSEYLRFILGLAVTAIITVYAYRKKLEVTCSLSFRKMVFFLLGSSNLIFCFFVNSNYYYRYIFIVMTLPLIFDLRRFPPSPFYRRFSHAYLILSLFVLFNELFLMYTIHSIQYAHHIPNHYHNIIVISILTLSHAGSWGLISILLFLSLRLCLQPSVEKISYLRCLLNIHLFKNTKNGH